MELNNLQKLAVADAMAKKIKELTNPRGGEHGAPTLRTEADDALRDAYEQDGTDRRRIIINGQDVGTLSACISKPESGTRVAIANSDEFIDWLRTSDGGLDTLKRLVSCIPDKVVEAATVDGELPDGCVVEYWQKPAVFKHTVLRVSPEKVGAALAGELPGAVMGLLGGGE